MIGDYLSDFESRRQRGYQDLQRSLGNDIATYPFDQRRVADRQRRYAADMSDFNAAMDRSYDPDWWQKQQFENARAAYAPENYQPPQGLIDSYAPLRAETAANLARQQQAQESQRAAQDAARVPDPAPMFDRNGELIDRTGVVDFEGARRSAIDRSQTQFQQPSTAPARSYARPMGSTYPVSVTTEDVAPIVAGGRTRYSGTMADTLAEGAARTPLGGMQSNIGDIVTGRDGVRARRTAVGYTDNLAPDAVAAQGPSNDDLYRAQQGRNAAYAQQMNDYAAQQKAERQRRLRGSLMSSGVRQGPYGQIPFTFGRAPTEAELDYA